MEDLLVSPTGKVDSCLILPPQPPAA